MVYNTVWFGYNSKNIYFRNSYINIEVYILFEKIPQQNNDISKLNSE